MKVRSATGHEKLMIVNYIIHQRAMRCKMVSKMVSLEMEQIGDTVI
jgi:hypothetical protein